MKGTLEGEYHFPFFSNFEVHTVSYILSFLACICGSSVKCVGHKCELEKGGW